MSEVGGLLGKLLFAVSSDYLISKKLVGAAHLITCKSFHGLSVSLADSQGSLSQSTGPASVGSSSLPLHSSLFLPRPSRLNNSEGNSVETFVACLPFSAIINKYISSTVGWQTRHTIPKLFVKAFFHGCVSLALCVGAAVADGGVVWIWILGWRDGGHVQSLSDGECASSSVSHFSWHRRLPHSSRSV